MRIAATKHIPALLLAVICLFLYLPTMARSIYTEDSAEFITAAQTLSIPHPSGYPAFLLSSKLLSYIPTFPTVTERMNALSVFWTMLAVVLLYYAMARLFKNRLISFSLGLLFTLVPMVWLQATYTEVYALNTFFFTLLFWLFLAYWEDPKPWRMNLLFFVYGLSLTNHYLPLIVGPLLLGWLLTKYHIIKQAATYLRLFGFWMIGLIPYAYIPVRARMDTPFVWFGGDMAQILKYNIAYGHTISADTFRFITDATLQLFHAYGAISIIALVFGLVLMIYYKYPLRYPILAALLLFSVGLIIAVTNGADYTMFAGWFYQNLYVPLLLAALIPIGFALKVLSEGKYKLIFYYTALLSVLIWPVMQIGDRFSSNDRSTYVFLDSYATHMLDILPQNAALFVHSDMIVNDPIVFSLAFKQYVQHEREDVRIFSLSPVFPAPYNFPIHQKPEKKNDYLTVVKNYISGHAYEYPLLYTTFPIQTDRLTSISIGPAYRVLAANNPLFEIATPDPYVAENLYLPATEDSFFNNLLTAKYYYDLAAQAFARGATKSGQWFLVQAIAYDPEGFSQYYNDSISVRNHYLKIDETAKQY